MSREPSLQIAFSNGTSMIACFDVCYSDNQAFAAAVVLKEWADTDAVAQYTLRLGGVGDYQPGRFFERELKPVLELINAIDHPIKHYVIDAYCHLSDTGLPGLGAHLYQTLPEGSVVVGVAKNRFRDTTHAVELLRGISVRPLFVTSIGIDYQNACKLVASMAGKHRLPDMLKLVDRPSRSQGEQ